MAALSFNGTFVHFEAARSSRTMPWWTYIPWRDKSSPLKMMAAWFTDFNTSPSLPNLICHWASQRGVYRWIPTCRQHAEPRADHTPRSVLAFIPDVAFLLLSLRNWSVFEVRFRVFHCFFVPYNTVKHVFRRILCTANLGWDGYHKSAFGWWGHQQPGSVYVNLKEVVPALMAGLDGLINYLTFWKSVEWISLLFGIGCFILWVSGKMVMNFDQFWDAVCCFAICFDI